MTLPVNKLSSALEKIYGKEWRTTCPEETDYTYGHIWRMIAGKSNIPLIFQNYLNLKKKCIALEKELNSLKKKDKK